MTRILFALGIVGVLISSCSADEPIVNGKKKDKDSGPLVVEEDQRVETASVDTPANSKGNKGKGDQGKKEEDEEDEKNAGLVADKSDYEAWEKESINLFDLNVPIGKVGGQYLALSETVIMGWNGDSWSEYAPNAPFAIADFKVDAQGAIFATLINAANAEEIWRYSTFEGWKQVTLPQAGLENFYVKSPTKIRGCGKLYFPVAGNTQ